MTEAIKLTTRQNEYLDELRGGKKSTHDMVLSQGVSSNSVAKAMKTLRDLGLIVSSPIAGVRGKQFEHRLSDDFEENNVKVWSFGTRKDKSSLDDANIQCAVDLRNEGFTGQQMYAEFRRRMDSERSDASVKHIVNKARRRKEWK